MWLPVTDTHPRHTHTHTHKTANVKSGLTVLIFKSTTVLSNHVSKRSVSCCPGCFKAVRQMLWHKKYWHFYSFTEACLFSRLPYFMFTWYTWALCPARPDHQAELHLTSPTSHLLFNTTTDGMFLKTWSITFQMFLAVTWGLQRAPVSLVVNENRLEGIHDKQSTVAQLGADC